MFPLYSSLFAAAPYRDESLEMSFRSGEEKERSKQIMDSPVVFGVCVVAAGRRVVDYYMTWRGKTVRVSLSPHNILTSS